MSACRVSPDASVRRTLTSAFGSRALGLEHSAALSAIRVMDICVSAWTDGPAPDVRPAHLGVHASMVDDVQNCYLQPQPYAHVLRYCQSVGVMVGFGVSSAGFTHVGTLFNTNVTQVLLCTEVVHSNEHT